MTQEKVVSARVQGPSFLCLSRHLVCSPFASSSQAIFSGYFLASPRSCRGWERKTERRTLACSEFLGVGLSLLCLLNSAGCSFYCKDVLHAVAAMRVFLHLCRTKEGLEVDWTREHLLESLAVFVALYETRPITNNVHGMQFDHSFGLWFIASWLQPELVIESGAYKGHSTWVLRQVTGVMPFPS